MKAQALLHGEEVVASGSAYSSNVRSLPDYEHGAVLWLTPIRGEKTEEVRKHNTAVSKARNRVEHVFHTLKCAFGYKKVRHNGLAKNTSELYSLFMLGNIYRVLALSTHNLRRK